MNYTTNLHLPIIPSSQYSTTRVADMIAANQGDSASSAFNIIDAAVAGKQDQITVNPAGEIATATVTTMKIDGVVYNVASTITIDSALSTTSTNPVENRVITNALNSKQEQLTVNPTGIATASLEKVTIDGVIYNISSAVVIDDTLSTTSTNPVQNKVITDALNLKVSKSDLDDAMNSFFTFNTERIEGGSNLGSITVGTNVWNIPEGGGTITIDDKLSDTSENPVQNKVIKSALDLKLDATEVDDISITLSESRSSSPSALTLQSITFNDSSGTTIYNMPDVTGLFTVGYNYTTPVSSGDVIADAGLIAAYNAHMPITINGWLLSYQNVSGSDVRYLTATLSGTNVLSRIVVFNTSTNTVTFYNTVGSTVVVNPTLEGTESKISSLEVNGVKYSVITAQEVQSMIDASISNALTTNY